MIEQNSSKKRKDFLGGRGLHPRNSKEKDK